MFALAPTITAVRGAHDLSGKVQNYQERFAIFRFEIGFQVRSRGGIKSELQREFRKLWAVYRQLKKNLVKVDEHGTNKKAPRRNKVARRNAKNA